MAIDRGGLQYRITVEDAFSRELDDFREGVRGVRAELTGLARSARRLRPVTQEIRRATRATRDSRAASAREARDALNNASIRATALRRVQRATREAAVEQARSRRESQRNFNNSRRLATSEQNLEQINKRLTRVLNERARRENTLNEARRRNIRLTDEESRRLRVLTREQEQQVAARRRLQALQNVAGSTELRRINAETEALRIRNRVAQQAAVAEILRRQGLNAQGQQLTLIDRLSGASEKRRAVLQRLSGVFGKVNEQANRVSFTFRRLFGILAAFAAARAVIRGFQKLVSETIRFNAAIEQATLGIASLFLAVGDVRTITGQTTTTARGLEIAFAAARKQVQLLRRDALQSAATFEQLLETFQVAVAPGLQSGLDIDQVRKFTLDVSRAAAAIGLQQNQLAEEIRSILSGTIQARTTRIAVALGITNEDIRQAREAGALFDFLQERFSAFDEAGQKALETFNALFTNLVGAFQQVLESGGLAFFNELKSVLEELFNTISTADDITGILSPTPQAVGVIQAFTESLREGLVVARAVAKELTFDEVEGAARNVGFFITNVIRFLAAAIRGIIQGFRDLNTIVESILRVFNALDKDGGFDIKKLEQVVTTVTRILTVIIALQVATGTLRLVWGSIVIIIGAASAAITVFRTAIGLARLATNGLALAWGRASAAAAPLIGLPLLIAAAILVAVTAAIGLAIWFKNALDNALGLELKLVSVIGLVRAFVTTKLKQFGLIVAKFFQKTSLEIQALIQRGLGALVLFAFKTIESLTEVLARAGVVSKDLLKTANRFRLTFEAGLQARTQATADQIEALTLGYNKAIANLESALVATTLDIIDKNDTAKTVAEYISEFTAGALAGVRAVGSTLLAQLVGAVDFGAENFVPEGADQAVESLVEKFERLGGVISNQRKSLEKNVELINEFKKSSDSAAQDLAVALGTLGFDGAAAELRERSIKSTISLQRQQLDFIKEEDQVRARISGLEVKRARQNERIAALSSEQRDYITDIETSLANIENLKQAEARQEVLVSLAKAQSLALQRDGDRDGAAAAEERYQLENRRLEAAKALLRIAEEQANKLREQSGLAADDAAQAEQVGLQRISTAGELTVAREQVNMIEKDLLRILRLQNEILDQQLQLVAERAAVQAREDARTALAVGERVRAEEQANAATNAAAARVILAQAEADILRREIGAAQDIRQRELEAVTRTIVERTRALENLKRAASDSTDPEETVELNRQITTAQTSLNSLKRQQYEQQLLNNEATNTELSQIEQLLRLLEEARRSLEEPVEFGLVQGVKEFISEALDIFTTFKDIVKNSFDELGAVIGRNITGALTGKGTNFRQEFAQFLDNIAQQIITMLIRVAIAKALLGLGFLGGGEVPEPSLASVAIGRQQGGDVPRAQGARVLAHFDPRALFRFAKGFAAGGMPDMGGSVSSPTTAARQLAAFKPRNIDPRDTVPIWAQPGEWVMRSKAVKKYGADAMAALNNLSVNPEALRAIAGVNGSSGHSRRISGAAQAGGQITPSSGAPTVAVAGQRSGGLSPSYIIGSEATMQEFLSGGPNTLLDFLQEKGVQFKKDRA